MALRKRQYTMDDGEKLLIAKMMIRNKLAGQAGNIYRFVKNHPEKATNQLIDTEEPIRRLEKAAMEATHSEELRGIEGSAANAYFSVFDQMLLTGHESLRFSGRVRRPPGDRCNALLSFIYSMLVYDCMAAAESFGIDPYVGVLHGDRPGRASMALDLMEEFRPLLADRLVCRLINLNIVQPEMFEQNDDGGIRLTSPGRRVVLREWNQAKQREKHFAEIGAKVPRGIQPYLRAQSISAYLRADCCEEALPGVQTV